MMMRHFLALALLAAPVFGASFSGTADHLLEFTDATPGLCHAGFPCFDKDTAWTYCTFYRYTNVVAERTIVAKWSGIEPSSRRYHRATVTTANQLEFSRGNTNTIKWTSSTLSPNTWYAICFGTDGTSSATSGFVYQWRLNARPIVLVDNASWPCDINGSSGVARVTIGGRDGEPHLGAKEHSMYIAARITFADAETFAHRPTALAAKYSTTRWHLDLVLDPGGTSWPNLTAQINATELGDTTTWTDSPPRGRR